MARDSAQNGGRPFPLTRTIVMKFRVDKQGKGRVIFCEILFKLGRNLPWVNH